MPSIQVSALYYVMRNINYVFYEFYFSLWQIFRIGTVRYAEGCDACANMDQL